jgi:hypothetical protein
MGEELISEVVEIDDSGGKKGISFPSKKQPPSGEIGYALASPLLFVRQLAFCP